MFLPVISVCAIRGVLHQTFDHVTSWSCLLSTWSVSLFVIKQMVSDDGQKNRSILMMPLGLDYARKGEITQQVITASAKVRTPCPKESS